MFGSSSEMFRVKSLEKFGSNNCIIHKNEFHEKVYNYAEVIEGVDILCKQFKGLNLPQSKCIAVKLAGSHTPGSICLLLAILNYNCHFFPLQEDLKDQELYNILTEGCASFVVLSKNTSIQETHSKMKAELKIFDELFFIFSIPNSLDEIKLPANMCYTIGTSGSTGRPKMVHVPYDCIAPNIHALRARFKTTRDDVIFLGTPITFDPFVVELFLALSCGAAVLITTSKLRLAPEKLIDLLWSKKSGSQSVTILQTTPSLFRQFGEGTIRDVILAESSPLRVLILGGEEFPRCTELKKWLPQNEQLRKRIFNIYGITEISCWSTIYELKSKDLIGNRCIPIGEPIDDMSLRIIDSGEEHSSASKQRGELLLGSSSRRTYIRDENDGNTQTTGNEDIIFYRNTGDLVERNEAGEVVYLGRLKNTIKRIGKRICLDSLAQKIADLFSLAEVVKVICLWNSDTQSLICCLKSYVDSEENDSFATKKRKIMHNLKSDEKPDRIVQIETIPLNKHGKVDRKKLLETINTSEIPEPVDILRHFLKETLMTSPSFVKRQKLDDSLTSFTALGGTSFHALSLATEIGKYLSNTHDQRHLLEQLLNSDIPISNILTFLENVPITQIPQQSKELRPESLAVESLHRTLKFLWRVDMQKCVDATPAVDFEKRYICIGSHAHLLLTIDTCTGKEISRVRLRSRIECEAVFVSSDLALVGCNAGYLYAFNIRSGKIIWSIYIGCKVKAKPLVINTTHAMIGCYDDEFNLVYICLKTQRIEWRKKIGSKPIFSSPLLFDKNTALVCTLDGTYVRLDVRNGNVMWSRKCASPIFTTGTIIENDRTFGIAEVVGKVHICKIDNGAILNSFCAEGNVFSNLIIRQVSDSNIQIIFGCHDHNVYCLNYMLNQEKDITESLLYLNWKTKFDAAVYATPAILQFDLEYYVIVCSTEGMLTVLELQKGSKVVTSKVEGEIFSSPCCVRNKHNEFRIYFGSRDNFIYCFTIF